MSHAIDSELRQLVFQLLSSETPGDDLIRMRLNAKPDGDNPTAIANYLVLVALAKLIGTQDPMAEANLRGVAEKRGAFEDALRSLLEAKHSL
jgi:hypothetical protein